MEKTELDFQREVEIPLNELVEQFEDSDITQNELDSFITEYLTDSISY